MAKRIRSGRRTSARRMVVASLALSSTVCLGVWKGGAPSFTPDSSPSQRPRPLPTMVELSSLEIAAIDRLPVTPWLASASELTCFPPLRIGIGGAWDHWSAGTSLDHTSLGRATSLVVPLLSTDTSDPPGLGSGILTGPGNTSGEFVGPVGPWDKLGLGASPSLPTAIQKPLVIRVEHKAPTDPLRDSVAGVSHRVGRWLAGDVSSPGAEPLATVAAGWASRASLLTSPQLASGGDRLAFASTPVAAPQGRSADAPRIDWIDPELARQIELSATATWLPNPTALTEQIAALSGEPMTEVWAGEALALLAMLERQSLAGGADERQIIEHMARLSQGGWHLAESATSEPQAVRIRRASLAMWRRAECWNAAAQLIQPKLDRVALAANYTSVLKAHPASLRAAAWPTFGRTEIIDLLSAVERYETAPNGDDSRAIARAIEQLQASGGRDEQRLAAALDDSYRNANLRLSLSKDFLELWLPPTTTRTEGVADRIVGTPVRGHAHVTTDARIELIPNPDMWQVALQTEGRVESFTTARRGMVSVVSRGNTDFSASQQLMLDGDGVRQGAVLSDVTSRSYFLRASSSYDLFPIVRGVVRNQARDRFAASRLKARREIEAKTEQRVRSQFETQVAEALGNAEGRWANEVASRLATGGIELEAVEFKTTASRLVSRARLLEFDQLTSHTPRPRAPHDSIASLQVHESALRGLAATLQLDGARFTTGELGEWLSQHLGPSFGRSPAEGEEIAIIRFAPDRAIDVALRDGQLELTLSIYELAVRDILIRDFKVHSYYTPRVDGLHLALERTEGPYFEGALRNRERMQLNTIFGKNQRQGERLELGSKLLDDERLAGLSITQLVINDGWLGIALGPDEERRVTQLDRYQAIR